MLKDFKTFIMRGNVVDMAVGIIIGGAFGTIVKSLVDDVLMPPIGLLLLSEEPRSWLSESSIKLPLVTTRSPFFRPSFIST